MSTPTGLELKSIPTTSPTTDNRPKFEQLSADLSTQEAGQSLKAAEAGFGEALRTAGFLVSRVFQAAYNVYDNARTNYRASRAAAELAKFNPEKIATGDQANSILKQWTAQAEQSDSLKLHMTALGGSAAKIVDAAHQRITVIRNEINEVFSRVMPGVNTEAFFGDRAAETIADLSPKDRRKFLAGYSELRTKLSELNELAKTVNEQARAFYNSSVAGLKLQSEFDITKLEPTAAEFYKDQLKSLNKEHLEGLSQLTDNKPTPEQIAELGNKSTQALKECQEKTLALSESHKEAREVTEKINATLRYLTKGLDGKKSQRALENREFVFVGAKAADAIANWVLAEVSPGSKSLTEALKANDPAAIKKATEDLASVSKAVHKELADVATLLGKVNAGKSVDNHPNPDQGERIIARIQKEGLTADDSLKKPLTEYVNTLRKAMESRIVGMFTIGADGKYDLNSGRERLAVIDKYDDMLERTIDLAAADGKLTAEEVQEAIKKTLARFKTELEAAETKRTKIDEFMDSAEQAKRKELSEKEKKNGLQTA